MSDFIIDPKVVGEHLKKPYNLRDAWDKAGLQGTPPEPGELFYSSEELTVTQGELSLIYNQLVKNCQPVPSGQSKRFILSAGAPGAGKTTLLEDLLVQEVDLQNMVFSDPDERALKLMQVYKDDIDAFGGGLNGLTLAYTKWRWASNYISGTIMNRANEEGYNILHGTTATSPFVSILYDNAHNEGYETTTHIVCAPDDVRVQSAKRRFEEEQTRYTHDTKEKGKLFYERVPTLFDKTKSFGLYWREAVDSAPVLAASAENGIITETDNAALSAIDNDFSGTSNLSWQALQNTYSKKFHI